MNPITLTKKFSAELVEEYSSVPTVTKLGRHDCEMTLHIGDPIAANLGSCIVWNYERGDEGDETVIGIEHEGLKVTGYDGVFSLPKEALELLREAGFDTREVE